LSENPRIPGKRGGRRGEAVQERAPCERHLHGLGRGLPIVVFVIRETKATDALVARTDPQIAMGEMPTPGALETSLPGAGACEDTLGIRRHRLNVNRPAYRRKALRAQKHRSAHAREHHCTRQQ
jgi:hypothetical protein